MAAHAQAIRPTGVKLEPKLKLRLKRLSKIKQRSVHWLMKDAIAHYLDVEEEAEKLKQETLTRWQEAEEGKWVSHDAVAAWLKTWGTTQEKGRPKCD